MDELVAVAEIAQIICVSRQRVHQLMATDPTFPDPAAELSAGRIWKRDDVEAWARATGRLL